MRWILVLVAALFLAAPAQAEEDVPDCAAAWRTYIYGPWSIAKGMADYKAALDAGYKACSEKEPEAFAGTAELHDFLKENTEREMAQARDVLDYMIAHPDERKLPGGCAKDEAARDQVQDTIHKMVDGQYSKAYGRRLKALSEDRHVAEKFNSCTLVLKMVKDYRAYYDRYDQMRNVLYESSKKKGRIQLTGGDKRTAFRRFETVRDELFDGK